jgi:hypothetical protein
MAHPLDISAATIMLAWARSATTPAGARPLAEGHRRPGGGNRRDSGKRKVPREAVERERRLRVREALGESTSREFLVNLSPEDRAAHLKGLGWPDDVWGLRQDTFGTEGEA